MKRMALLLLIMLLLSFNYAYSKKDCKLLAFKGTDYTCCMIVWMMVIHTDIV